MYNKAKMHCYRERERKGREKDFVSPGDISADQGVTWTTCTFPRSSPRESEQVSDTPPTFTSVCEKSCRLSGSKQEDAVLSENNTILTFLLSKK